MSENKPPTKLLLVRHGENDWTGTHRLAGRTPGVYLNDYGRMQVEALGQRLASTQLDALYASPMERTIETAEAIVKHNPSLTIQPHDGLLEVDYGEWQGEAIKGLSEKPEWQVIQYYPSAAGFPAGETMYEMQTRFVHQLNRLVKQHPHQTIAVVGHADLIKSAVAHYLGVHLDLFQRIIISTASMTTVMFTPMAPRLVCINDTSHNPPKPEEPKKR